MPRNETLDNACKRITRDAIKESLAEIAQAFDTLFADRDEWREQHENLVGVRQADLAALTNSGAPVPGEFIQVRRADLEKIAQRRFQCSLHQHGMAAAELAGRMIDEAANPVPDDAGGALERAATVWREAYIAVYGCEPTHSKEAYQAAYNVIATALKAHAAPAPSDEAGECWVRVHKPTLNDLSAIGEAAESALLSEKGWTEIGRAVWDLISEDAEVSDWSNAIRGKFYSGKKGPEAGVPAGMVLVQAATELLERMSSTYKARNGREVGVQGDDGEKVWLVHSDEIEALRRALENTPKQATPTDEAVLGADPEREAWGSAVEHAKAICSGIAARYEYGSPENNVARNCRDAVAALAIRARSAPGSGVGGGHRSD
jgi:hypothetical protein